MLKFHSKHCWCFIKFWDKRANATLILGLWVVSMVHVAHNNCHWDYSFIIEVIRWRNLCLCIVGSWLYLQQEEWLHVLKMQNSTRQNKGKHIKRSDIFFLPTGVDCVSDNMFSFILVMWIRNFRMSCLLANRCCLTLLNLWGLWQYIFVGIFCKYWLRVFPIFPLLIGHSK